MSASQRTAAAVAGSKHDLPGTDRALRPFLLVSAGVLIVWATHNALLLPWEVHNIDSSLREPALVLLRALVWMLPLAFYLIRYDARPRLVALGVTSPIHGRGLAWSVLIAALYLAPIGMLASATAPPEHTPNLWQTLSQVSVICSLLASVLEELLMRGFLLGQLVRFTTSFRAQVCVAVLFGLVHLPGWIALEGFGIDQVVSVFMVMLLGAVLGGVTRASNNVFPAIAVHCANNFLASWLGGR